MKDHLDTYAENSNIKPSCPRLLHLPPVLCNNVGTKTDGKFSSGKVTTHSPTPRCDSFLSGKATKIHV